MYMLNIFYMSSEVHFHRHTKKNSTRLSDIRALSVHLQAVRSVIIIIIIAGLGSFHVAPLCLYAR